MQDNGIKMIYLIKRRPRVSREELIVHWFAHHMPGVIERQERVLNGEFKGMQAASRYVATLFDEKAAVDPAEDPGHWDGMAQLWYDEPLPMPKVPHGTKPQDSFQEKAQPYIPWATREYLMMSGDLPLAPSALNEPPFPCTRSGFYKRSLIVGISDDSEASFAEFQDHWLSIHAPNVIETMNAAGGFRYCVSQSLDHRFPYAGLAELYFPGKEQWDSFNDALKADGMERWVTSVLSFGSGTEMVGIA
ncbi:MAG: hypothetical protein AAF525_02540 [Pseudomonadota bacterium]